MVMRPDGIPADPEQIIADLRRQLAVLTAERDEALAQQAAVAEVVGIITASAGELGPVFDAILEQAHTLCGAELGSLVLYDGENLRAVATRGYPDEYARLVREGGPANLVPAFQRLRRGERVVHVADAATHPLSTPIARAAVESAGVRTLLLVPLRRDDALLGYISFQRREVRPFTDKQIALLENFAAQAVIAMENARLLTETREALEQQTATVEVLQVINSSPGDLAPVFEAMLERAMRLCGFDHGSLQVYEGQLFRAVAVRGLPEALAERLRQGFRPRPENPMGRLLDGDRFVQIPDLTEVEDARFAVEYGSRSLLCVPLRKDGVLLGQIVAVRREVHLFGDKEIALLENFAAQAVIAMENARLLGDLRQRTRELEESLEYQTATSDVLKVISRSTFALQPVLDTLVEAATRLCNADFGNLFRREEGGFRRSAVFGLTPEMWKDELLETTRATVVGRVALEAGIVHVDDVAADPEYMYPNAIRLAGVRSSLGVPLLREGEPIGVFTLGRRRVEPFTERQIGLVRSFADQAVIAMENARLLTETREALEQQTATAEVLQVINSSPGDLAPVFSAILEKAHTLCGAEYGVLLTYDGERFWPVATHGHTLAFANAAREGIRPGFGFGKLLAGERLLHIRDMAELAKQMPDDPIPRALAEISGIRTQLAVPLCKDDKLLGIITANRREVRPFTDKQIALLENFAAQAVIAMENARLLGELRRRTEEIAELNRGLEARVAAQVEELGRVGRLKRFLAPQLAELIVSQGDENILESHRREIVVVFCDLRGYTAFTETAEPEEVLDFLREYHGALGPLVSQYEGTLDQFSGDGIMVFFNDPVPCADPAGRAVAMAVAMREATGALTAAWRERGRELGFGAGIAQGYATLGQIGFAERSGYTAIGTVCNVAARLCAEAGDGQILLSQRVNLALGGTVATEPVGALALKGLAQPVVAYNVPLAAA